MIWYKKVLYKKWNTAASRVVSTSPQRRLGVNKLSNRTNLKKKDNLIDSI